jgi:four helix bundle protein
MAVRCYRDLIVWQKAMDFVVLVYRMTAAFPKEELYGLTLQLRRAAVSVPSNIAGTCLARLFSSCTVFTTTAVAEKVRVF